MSDGAISQDEIDALQDANDERERALNLAQKMYNLYME